MNIKIFYLLILIFCLQAKAEKIIKDKNNQNKNFVIVIPSYNNEKWYKQNLNSVFRQTYKKFRVIYIDDCSTDQTLKLVKKHIKNFNNVTLLKNNERQGALANHFKAIHLCDDDEIIVCLDGDDWFYDNNTLKYLNEVYQDPDIWLTYGQYETWPTKEMGLCQEYPLNFVKRNDFRGFGFFAHQVRTYYAWLAKQVKLQDLISNFKGHEGKFFPTAGDVALMFPMLEMARNNYKFLSKKLMYYNIDNQLNDFKINDNLQNELTEFIRTKDKYQALEQPIKNFEKNKKADLIIFSYDRPLQLYALLESIEKNVNGLDNITIIYKVSSSDFEKSYEELKNRFLKAKFIQQNNKESLKPLLLGEIFSSSNQNILLAVDDLIIKDFIDISECISQMQKTHAFSFLLSLGKNITRCYKENAEENVPPCVEINKDIYVYQFKFGQLDWDFPTSFEMTLFQKKDLLNLLQNLNFNSPKTLEFELYNKFIQDNKNYDKVGLFFKNSKIINVPMNTVQSDYLNNNKNLIDKYDCLSKFNSGLKIDISKFNKINNNTTHVDSDLTYLPRDTTLQNDLTFVGKINFSQGIARIPIIICDLLKENLKINFIHTLPYALEDISKEVKNLILNNNTSNGNVALFTDILWYPDYESYKFLPNSKIKIANSMLESSKIPNEWTQILNSEFDAVVVPDEFLVDTYKNSGVKIPIFVLPLPIYIDEFLKKPKKTQYSKPIVFGFSAESHPRKNFDLVVEAFFKAFGNTNEVVLKIHSKNVDYLENLKKLIHEKNIKNIELIEKEFPWKEYVDFISSLDCYVFLSKGEGFSITPREALAAGIPCILSNNTAHKVICKTDYVLSVDSNIEEDAYYSVFGKVSGKFYNCSLNDSINALKEMYNNYPLYLEKAQQGREWVKRYLPEKLKLKYLNLIKPKKVILADKNEITDDYLMTNSKDLYNKYQGFK